MKHHRCPRGAMPRCDDFARFISWRCGSGGKRKQQNGSSNECRDSMPGTYGVTQQLDENRRQQRAFADIVDQGRVGLHLLPLDSMLLEGLEKEKNPRSQHPR